MDQKIGPAVAADFYAALRILWIKGAIFLKSSTNDCICSCRD
jgi:hypothetical protein